MSKKNVFLVVLLLVYLTCNTAIYYFLITLKMEKEQTILLNSTDIDISRYSLVLITIMAVYSWGGVIFNKSNFNDLDSDTLLKILYITGFIASPFIYLSLDMFIAKVIEPLTAIVSFAFVAIVFIFFSKYIKSIFINYSAYGIEKNQL